MRRFFIYCLTCLMLLIFMPVQAANPDMISSSYGNIEIPTEKEINTALAEVQSSSALTDEQKKQETEILNNGLALISKLNQLKDGLDKFNHSLQNADHNLQKLANDYTIANKIYNQPIPDISNKSAGALTRLATKLNTEQQQVQKDLAAANSDFIYLQTLPIRAQNTIAGNNQRINELTSSTNGSSNLDNRIGVFEVYVLNQENDLLQKQLASQTELLDIANYKVRINTLKNKYLTDYLKEVQIQQNDLIAKELLSGAEMSAAGLDKIPVLKKEIGINQLVSNYIDKQLQQNRIMAQELHEVEDALTSMRQIEKNLKDQLSELDGSLVLSRLLNRQQSEIPQISISENFDEIIPNLNLKIFDMREQRNKILDIGSYVDNIITLNPALNDYRDDLEKIVRYRSTLYDQLYSAFSTGLNQAINLKLRYAEYKQTKDNVSSVINDHLFWLASNQHLGYDFFNSMLTEFKLQINSLFTSALKNNHWLNSLKNLLTIIIPTFIIGFIFFWLKPFFERSNDKLALRLDKSTDNLWVTPLAVFYRLFVIIPKAVFILLCGSVFVYLGIDNVEHQHQVLILLAMHIFIFVYILDILRPNSLIQRHFSTPPKILAIQRQIIDHVWFALIPILIVANIRELEPANIANDIIGFCTIIVCSAYLTILMVKTFRNKLAHEGWNFNTSVIAPITILIPLALLITVSMGYYYTAIKLINRVAFSFYTCLAYVLISNIIRRELYVIENRMIRGRMNQNKAESKPKSKFSEVLKKTGKGDNLRFDFINAKAFKLINIALLCITAGFLYAQWSDLAGVLSYLDTISLWSSSEIVNGKEVITSNLTLGDVCACAIILLIAAILNRNLPPLLERLTLLKITGDHKSTGYTVRILSSYLITAAGLTMAAGAIGIEWNNLQWLVSALLVGLGFGLQEIFANFVSGLIILFERQIRVGDIVTLDGLSGTVSKIRIRATTIVSFDNKEVMIPNRQFITSALTNWSLTSSVTMLEFEMGVSYDADLEKSKEILRHIVRRCKYLVPDRPAKIYVKSLDDSWITIMCEVYVKEIGMRKDTFDYLSTESLRLFDEAGIDIPYNQIDVNLINPATGAKAKIASSKIDSNKAKAAL